jgi:hypothetical protein
MMMSLSHALSVDALWFLNCGSGGGGCGGGGCGGGGGGERGMGGLLPGVCGLWRAKRRWVVV